MLDNTCRLPCSSCGQIWCEVALKACRRVWPRVRVHRCDCVGVCLSVRPSAYCTWAAGFIHSSHFTRSFIAHAEIAEVYLCLPPPPRVGECCTRTTADDQDLVLPSAAVSRRDSRSSQGGPAEVLQ